MTDSTLDAEGLRKRLAAGLAATNEDARQKVLQLNAVEERSAKNEKDRKTYGRTPDGTVFVVPHTHDMVSQLLSPSEPKNLSDLAVLLILACHIAVFYLLSPSWRASLFSMTFLFWRASYNIGIGSLLQVQSHHQMLVRWAKRTGIFVNPTTGSNPHPKLYAFIKRELETKIPEDYNFETAPIEYNTWLLFRRVVDLILMCDFVSYVLMAIACATRPSSEMIILTSIRWLIGLLLFAFNLWVKLDAHRVVKDFAWYWGDFFFLIDQELTFDGVFEMAPHPMYSIGYAGYYGISLMAASYKVLFISIIAHAAQFVFLIWVESPHIERTYSSPPPARKQLNDMPTAIATATASEQVLPNKRIDGRENWPNDDNDKPPATHDLLGLRNLDLYRTTDSSVFITLFLLLLLTVLTPDTPLCRTVFVLNAAVFRLWYSVGLGYLLNRQSTKKKWTRHFLKYGDSTREAWRQWKGTYHLSMTLCYASYVAAAWKMYSWPRDWDYGFLLLKHVVGLGLVALQIWVSFSIYDQLGEFGWFFGDFFFDHQPKLTYDGIYRFLNNPERVLGLAGVWGIALITSSKSIFFVALFSHILSLLFIQFVERPHMQKLYGRHLRQDAGLVRSLRRSLPPPLRQWQDGMDRVLGETFDVVDDLLEVARPKLAAGVSHIVQDTKGLFHRYPPRISITRVEPEIFGLDPADYSIEIMGTPALELARSQRSSDKEAEGARTPGKRTNDFKPLLLEYGAPIKVKWTAPTNHSKKDWIGLYMVSDNDSRLVTKLASSGRWIPTNPGVYDIPIYEAGLITSDVPVNYGSVETAQIQDQFHDCVTGEMVFSGDKLWWTQGVFEFRYHHNGKHNVMAISLPYEIRIPQFTEDELEVLDSNISFSSPTSPENEFLIRRAIENTLLPVVRNCFDRDPDIAPAHPKESFGSMVERDGKYAKRVVYAVHQMFGIEFAPEVVKADGKVENLAWRIWEAKKVLAPYSLSRSKGTSTPIESGGK